MASRLLNSLLFLMATVSVAQEADLTCVEGTIQKITFGKMERFSSRYCFNSKKTTLVSKGCLNQNCLAYKVQKKFTFESVHSEVGSPGFALCREISGKPELIKFEASGKLYDLDRCIFSDGEYVDTGVLLGFYLRN